MRDKGHGTRDRGRGTVDTIGEMLCSLQDEATEDAELGTWEAAARGELNEESET